MADSPKNMVASVKARLLTISGEQGRAFDLLLVRFALNGCFFAWSLSPRRDSYIFKGGMLVTQWLEQENRETRDIDLLGFGPDDEAAVTAIFAEIMTIRTVTALSSTSMRLQPAGSAKSRNMRVFASRAQPISSAPVSR